VFCNQKANCNSRIKVGHGDFSKKINSYGNTYKWCKGINGTPNTPCTFASMTTEPVANTTTIKVPITSAINFL